MGAEVSAFFEVWMASSRVGESMRATGEASCHTTSQQTRSSSTRETEIPASGFFALHISLRYVASEVEDDETLDVLCCIVSLIMCVHLHVMAYMYMYACARTCTHTHVHTMLQTDRQPGIGPCEITLLNT